MQAKVKSIYFHHPSQGNSTNYYLILGLRDKAAPPTSQQINKFPSKRVKNLATPSSFFSFFFFSFLHSQESSALSQSEAMIVEQGECSQNMMIEAFQTPNIASTNTSNQVHEEKFAQLRTNQLHRILPLGSRRNVRPIKNGLKAQKKGRGSISLRLSFFFKKAVVCGHCLCHFVPHSCQRGTQVVFHCRSPAYLLKTRFLTGRMFVREPSWKYSAKLVGS